MFNILNTKIKLDDQAVLLTTILFLLLFIIIKRIFFNRPVVNRPAPYRGWWDWEDERVSNWPVKNMTYSLGEGFTMGGQNKKACDIY